MLISQLSLKLINQFKRSDFVKYLAIKNCVKTFLKNIYYKTFLKKLKNIVCFNVLGHHCQVKKYSMNVR